VKRQGDQVELDSRSATKTLIPLAEWQAFADTLQVSVSTVSVNTVERTPALEKMARDVVAFRREAPTDEAWGAERPSAAPTAPIPFPPPAAPSEEPLPPAAQQETTLRLRDGVRLHELRFVEWRPASLVYVNALGQQVEVKRERILMQLLTGDLILSGYKPAWAMRPAERKPEATTVEKPGHRARRWGYDYGLVVKGHLRKWHWITGKCICAECRAPIGEQGTEQVEGEPGAWYRECQGPEKHAIKTERDMTWKHPYLGANPGADGKTYDTAGVQEAYPWLQAVPDEEEIPF
jgi:hypothetical protein